MHSVQRFKKAIALFDQANSNDPNVEIVEGSAQPKEVVYAQRMTAWVAKLDPDAPEALRLAARAQHICRWEIPRSGYPMDKAGYYKWRTTLYRFHADTAGEILEAAGYEPETIAAVQALLLKKDLKTDPHMQSLEDAAALVFLENHFAEFAQRGDMDKAKTIAIIQKTWAKMSKRGHQAALALDLPPEARGLVEEALA
jgi:hypothetical protein